VAELREDPASATDQVVPDGSPLTMKVTVYATGVNETAGLTAALFSVGSP